MNITKTKLKEILSSAWEDSYNSIPKDDIVKDILEKYNIKEENDNIVEPIPVPEETEERIYLVKELMQMPINSLFIHKECGKCHMEEYENGRKMIFDEGFDSSGIKYDGYPFDVPMKLIS